MGLRQIGQLSCSLNQAPTHAPWNQWLQSSTVTSSPRLTSSIQILQSAVSFDSPNFSLPSALSSPNISLSNFFFFRFAIADADAGPGALEVGWLSIRLLSTLSNASCVNTASPDAAFAGLRMCERSAANGGGPRPAAPSLPGGAIAVKRLFKTLVHVSPMYRSLKLIKLTS
jgi:hypothetical protein